MNSILRELLYGDWRTKAMAALLAVTLWFYVNSEYAEKTPPLVAALAVQVPDGIAVLRIEDPTGHEVDQVSVVLKGTKGEVKSFSVRTLTCRPRVLLPEKGLEGMEVLQVPLSEKDFELPPGIRAEVEPASLRIAVAPETQQLLRVRTTDCTTGKPEEGYGVSRVEVSPTHVRVRGPRHLLKGRTEISIAKIDVTQARESFTQKSNIQPVLDGEKVSSADGISVSVTIEEEPVEKTFTSKVYVLLPAIFPHRFEPRPAEVSVRLRVPRSELPLLNEKNVLIIADPFELYSDPATQMQPGGTFKVPLRLRVRDSGPKGAKLIEALQEFILYLPPEEPEKGK